MLAALLVRELAHADPSRIEDDALRERMREADLEAGMRAAEVWPDR